MSSYSVKIREECFVWAQRTALHVRTYLIIEENSLNIREYSRLTGESVLNLCLRDFLYLNTQNIIVLIRINVTPHVVQMATPH